VGEVGGTFARRDRGEQAADGRPELVFAAGGGFAEQGLELGEDLLDGVQIGAVGRQVENGGTGGSDRLAEGASTPAAVVEATTFQLSCQRRTSVDQFGQGVLAEPPKSGFDLLAWLLPLGLLAAGAVGVGIVAWGWSHRRGTAGEDAAPPLDPELERRLDAELERYEA